MSPTRAVTTGCFLSLKLGNDLGIPIELYVGYAGIQSCDGGVLHPNLNITTVIAVIMSADKSDVACKFTAEIEQRGGKYFVEVPRTEIELGSLEPGAVCQVSVHTVDGPSKGKRSGGSSIPVSVGEEREVEIEGLGDEGDGIARVDRGYVLIIPETEPGDRVTVEITEVTPNVGFAEVLDEEAQDSAEVDLEAD